jgi:hypothetical protein
VVRAILGSPDWTWCKANRAARSKGRDVSRFFTREFFVDPYPTHEELRGEAVRWDEELDSWS